MHVVITGGTGFVGNRLCEALRHHGHQVTVLTRDLNSARRKLHPDIHLVAWEPSEAVAPIPDDADVIVNLAGESIAAGRWTEARKERIRRSRVEGTRAIVESIRHAARRPSVLVNASATGYYGSRGDEPLSEDAAPGGGYLTGVVLDWETGAHQAEALDVRVVLLRIGIVLGRGGGALPKMSLPFKLFAGGPIGNGKQWISWVHLDDVVGLITWALENPEVSGPINAVSPEPLRNVDFSRRLGEAMGRPSWLPAPAFALKLLFGDMADALLLNGQRVIPSRALQLGYQFKYPSARAALTEALG